jgi:hypothetical protein
MKSCIRCGFGTQQLSGYCTSCKKDYVTAIHTLVNRDFLVNLAIDTKDREWFEELSRIMVVGEIT